VALSPLIVTAALISPDLLGVTIASLGLWLWARERPVAAGVALGLATSARTYPVLIAVAIALLASRAGAGRLGARTLGVTLLTWTGVTVAAGSVTGWSVLRPYEAWAAAAADYGSPWFLIRLVGREVTPTAVTVLAVAGWVTAVAVAGAFALMARRRPTVAEVALVLVAIVLVTGKSFPVQSSLWLLPLAALAGVRWRDHLIWAGAEVVYFVAVWLYLGGTYDANRALPMGWYAVFTVLRFAGIAWLVWSVVRPALARPEAEEEAGDREAEDAAAALARAIAEDPDDLAGPLAGRRDAFVVAVS
jgi:uncharacterized membrane protein